MYQLFMDLNKESDSVRREVLCNKNVSEWKLKRSPDKQTFVLHVSY